MSDMNASLTDTRPHVTWRTWNAFLSILIAVTPIAFLTRKLCYRTDDRAMRRQT